MLKKKIIKKVSTKMNYLKIILIINISCVINFVNHDAYYFIL